MGPVNLERAAVNFFRKPSYTMKYIYREAR